MCPLSPKPLSPKPPKRRPCNAVIAAIGTEAACSNVTLSGFTTNADSGAHTYSAKAPLQVPNTASPGLNWVTFLPTASTWPATSWPIRVSFGLRRPVIMRTMYDVPRKSRSSGLTEAAPDSDQDFIVPSGRLFNLFTLEDIGWTVAVVDDCFHVNCCQDLLDRYQWLHLCALNQEPQHNPQFPRLRDHRKSVRRHNQ